MLIEFRVENHRSIRDEQVLSMEAGRVGTDADQRPRCVPGCSDKLLPVVGIYGANASGKSNVLSAMAFMKEAVTLSLRYWAPEDGVPRDPFAWGEAKSVPSKYEVTMVIDGVKYQYGFVADEKMFLEEWIFAWPNGKKQTWLEREGSDFKFGDNLRGENKIIEDITRDNALFLSAAAQLKHPQLSPIFFWFSSMETMNIITRRPSISNSYSDSAVAYMLQEANEGRQQTLFEKGDHEDSLLERFKALLRTADIGIVDVRVLRREAGTHIRGRPWRFELKHQSDSDDAWLPLEEESRGTRTLFRLALPILQALLNGTIIVVDELEASMHPNLAELIVRQFNDPAINKRNAQLIFTTHDTNLLGTLTGEPALRRDQVWLTEKDSCGATVLYPLTDFKPRNDENIERGYVQGRYGAIPFLGNFRIVGGDA
jgi:predicted ATPase